jgi:hypothetical protein
MALSLPGWRVLAKLPQLWVCFLICKAGPTLLQKVVVAGHGGHTCKLSEAEAGGSRVPDRLSYRVRRCLTATKWL